MSQHLASSPEITFIPEHSKSTKVIWKVFRILLIVTAIEVGFGLFMYYTDLSAGMVRFIKGVVVLLALVKSFYIISYFMHLGNEIRNFILTMVIPLLFIIWGIIVFLLDGRSFLNYKNTYDAQYAHEVKFLNSQPATKHLRRNHANDHIQHKK